MEEAGRLLRSTDISEKFLDDDDDADDEESNVFLLVILPCRILANAGGCSIDIGVKGNAAFLCCCCCHAVTSLIITRPNTQCCNRSSTSMLHRREEESLPGWCLKSGTITNRITHSNE